VVPAERYEAVPSYDSWWDVPVAEVAESESVRSARAAYDEARLAARAHL
jgi:3D-(3,5/4)-trihydroxycyclohexane-1,2-dione acylhydrolase (decyclizing)